MTVAAICNKNYRAIVYPKKCDCMLSTENTIAYLFSP